MHMNVVGVAASVVVIVVRIGLKLSMTGGTVALMTGITNIPEVVRVPFETVTLTEQSPNVPGACQETEGKMLVRKTPVPDTVSHK